MEANLRILQSFKKVNEKIEANEKKQKEINDKIDEFLKNISKEIKDLDSENEDLKKELTETIEKVKQEKPKDGKDGKDGSDGKDGQDGLDGVSVYDAEINKKGELILKLTNGKKINCGVVKGKDGIGFNGVGISKVEVVNGHLIVTLTTGKTIDAGLISGGVGQESDPTVPDYVKNITEKDIERWNNAPEYHDILDITGDIQNLETKDTTNIVNAINSLVGQGNGIPEISGDINIYNLDSGVYLLSGKSTRLLRNSYAWMTQPVPYEAGKSILVLTREAEFGEQGFLLKATQASPYVQLIAFDRTTQKEYNAMQLMSMTNTKSYNVTSDYQPAHKKYVDDRFNAIQAEIGGIIELGLIEMQDWDDDMNNFMNSLTDTGRYHFQDSWDNFDWYLEVHQMGSKLGQWYWYTEEGYSVQYFRDAWLNDDDEWEWSDWQSYVTWDTLQYMLGQLDNKYSLSGHTHTGSTILTSGTNFREWLNKQKYKTFTDFLVKINGTYERYVCKFYYDSQIGSSKFVYYQEYYDVLEPQKIYKRIGTAPSASTSATVTWQPWYVFEATAE